MSASDLAARLARDLGSLASDAGWSAEATSGQPQGHYTDAIADAMDDIGVDDLAEATPAHLRRVRQAALLTCLERLELYYATLTDIRVGQRDEKLSQIASAIGRIREAAHLAGTSVAKGVRLRRGPAVDYTAGEGDDA
jgi:hypothetical protein